MAASYLLQEDGTSHILLEDASGALITAADTGTPDVCSILTEDGGDFLVTETGEDLILEECGATTGTSGGNKLMEPARPRPRPRPRQHVRLAAPPAVILVIAQPADLAATVRPERAQIAAGALPGRVRLTIRPRQQLTAQDVLTMIELTDHRATPNPEA